MWFAVVKIVKGIKYAVKWRQLTTFAADLRMNDPTDMC